MGYSIKRVHKHFNLMPVKEDFVSLAIGLENEGFHSFLAAGRSIIWFLNNMPMDLLSEGCILQQAGNTGQFDIVSCCWFYVR